MPQINLRGLAHGLAKELGITALLGASRDVYILYLTRFFRMLAYGSSALILALYLSALGHSDEKIGLFMTVTLVGDVLISVALTLVADSLGRRRIMLLGAVLMVVSGCVFSFTSNYWILLLASVIGVISPSGNEIGPFRAVEESTLAHLSEAKTRSDIFALYVVFGTLGAAGGAFWGGWQVQACLDRGWDDVSAYRSIFWAYMGLGLIKAGLSLLLSRRCEAEVVQKTTERSSMTEESEAFLASENLPSKPPSQPPKPKKTLAVAQISAGSRKTLAKLCALFSVDSLASGMVPMSLISFYIESKFGMPTSQLGSIIATASFVASIGNILASSISKRIGLVRTMVFTHLPSAIFLALLPLPQSLAWAIFLLVARASLASMDQAPRTAFLSAVVLPNERTAVMGIVNTVKTASQSSGPLIAGLLAGSNNFWLAFVLAGSLKASYDIGMLTMFVNLKIDEGRDKVPNRENEETPEQFELNGSTDSETGEDDMPAALYQHEGGPPAQARLAPNTDTAVRKRSPSPLSRGTEDH